MKRIRFLNFIFLLPHVDEPIEQKMIREPLEEESNEKNEEHPNAMKSGYPKEKSKSSNTSKVLKTYPKRSSRNVPPKYCRGIVIP